MTLSDVVKTAGVLVYRGDAVLLVEHKSGAHHEEGVHGLPAGRVDEGESLDEAASRELFEETGLVVCRRHLLRLPRVYVETLHRDGCPINYSLDVFVAREYGGSLCESDETIPLFVPLSELDGYALLPNVREIVFYGRRFV